MRRIKRDRVYFMSELVKKKQRSDINFKISSCWFCYCAFWFISFLM